MSLSERMQDPAVQMYVFIAVCLLLSVVLFVAYRRLYRGGYQKPSGGKVLSIRRFLSKRIDKSVRRYKLSRDALIEKQAAVDKNIVDIETSLNSLDAEIAERMREAGIDQLNERKDELLNRLAKGRGDYAELQKILRTKARTSPVWHKLYKKRYVHGSQEPLQITKMGRLTLEDDSIEAARPYYDGPSDSLDAPAQRATPA